MNDRKKSHKEGNEARIKNIIAPLTKYEHTGGYSCKVCGNPFRTSPPDDAHRFSSVYQCWEFDWIERSFQCPECSNTTKLYWHPRVRKHHDYASREEVNRKFSKDNNSGNNPGVNYLQRIVGY
jgi:rubredoxin